MDVIRGCKTFVCYGLASEAEARQRLTEEPVGTAMRVGKLLVVRTAEGLVEHDISSTQSGTKNFHECDRLFDLLHAIRSRHP